MLKRFSLIISIVSLSITANAQSPADTTTPISPVKTLSYAQYLAYSKGDDVNDVGMVAEMHHYPQPAKVLKYKKELDLSPSQITKLKEFDAYLHKRTLQTGGSIISTEKTLDELFRSKKVNEGSIVYYTQRYGQYLGEYRNAVLFSCYSTQRILTPQQVQRFEGLEKAAAGK
jgi:hypothetical protein